MESININKECIISNQIQSIHHFPLSQIIQVNFETERKCQKPVLRGRLSGPALSLLKDWHWMINNNNTIQAYYNLPYKGRYYLEIIAIFCNDVVFEKELKDKCLLDAARNRITMKDSIVEVSKSNAAFFENPGIGHWVDKNLLSLASRNSNNLLTFPHYETINLPEENQTLNESISVATNISFHPVYTRFQSPSCKERNACAYEQSLHPFDSYYFFYNKKTNDIFYSSFDKFKNEMIKSMRQNYSKLCFLGASHAHRHSYSYLRLFQQDFKHHLDFFIELHFSEDISTVLPEIIEKNCSKVVLSIGQWDLSWPRQYPTLYSRFEKDVEKMLQEMKDFREKEAASSTFFDIYIRSVHEQPFGMHPPSRANVLCPAKGWIWPPSVRRYNEILQRISNSSSLTFINTTHIISPIWDAALDWCHYGHTFKNNKEYIDNNAGGKAADAEIIYILGKVNDLF